MLELKPKRTEINAISISPKSFIFEEGPLNMKKQKVKNQNKMKVPPIKVASPIIGYKNRFFSNFFASLK